MSECCSDNYFQLKNQKPAIKSLPITNNELMLLSNDTQKPKEAGTIT